MAQSCPACGSDNQCAVARRGGEEAQCWCMQVQLPPDALKVRSGEDAACYCPACAARLAAGLTVPG